MHSGLIPTLVATHCSNHTDPTMDDRKADFMLDIIVTQQYNCQEQALTVPGVMAKQVDEYPVKKQRIMTSTGQYSVQQEIKVVDTRECQIHVPDNPSKQYPRSPSRQHRSGVAPPALVLQDVEMGEILSNNLKFSVQCMYLNYWYPFSCFSLMIHN